MRKRMKTVRGLWAGLLAAAVVLTSAAPSALTVQAEEADAVQTAEVSGVDSFCRRRYTDTDRCYYGKSLF